MAPTGAGMPGPSYPHVAGQPAWYTARRLQEFRDGTTGERDTRMFQIMHTIAQPLTDEEIQALASYMEGLHPRPDAATRAQMARLQPDAPAEMSAPAADTRYPDPEAAGNPPAGAPGSPEASGIDPEQSAEPVQQQQ